MIGEQFDHGDEICGAVVSVRARQEKIAIWTKNASNEAAQVVLSKRKEDYIYIYIYIDWIVCFGS
jgi:translation initiation factor 4E